MPALLVDIFYSELSVVLLAVLQICDFAERFPEALEVYYLAFAEEFDYVDYVRIVREGQYIVIYRAGFLFWCDFVKTTK